MSDITIYKPADVNLIVINGDPPVDRSAEVLALQHRLAAKDTALQAAAVQIAQGLAA